MKKCVLIAAGFAAMIGLTGCKPTQYDAKNLAESLVKQGLYDPDSAQFSAMQFYESTPKADKETRLVGTVCGQVNAKNRFGGYTGYKYFYVGVILEDGAERITDFGIEPTSSKEIFNKKRFSLCHYQAVS